MAPMSILTNIFSSSNDEKYLLALIATHNFGGAGEGASNVGGADVHVSLHHS